MKAGTTIVSGEYEDWKDIDNLLSQKKVDVLVISPYVYIDKNTTRLNALTQNIPELNKGKL
jgi:hypothetical protein